MSFRYAVCTAARSLLSTFSTASPQAIPVLKLPLRSCKIRCTSLQAAPSRSLRCAGGGPITIGGGASCGDGFAAWAGAGSACRREGKNLRLPAAPAAVFLPVFSCLLCQPGIESSRREPKEGTDAVSAALCAVAPEALLPPVTLAGGSEGAGRLRPAQIPFAVSFGGVSAAGAPHCPQNFAL